MEAVMASAILFAGVLAVVSAILNGQQQALEAQRRVEALLAAEQIVDEMMAADYAGLTTWPTTQPAGEFLAITTKQESLEDLSSLGVKVRGMRMTIQIVPSMTDFTVLAEMSCFIPEPPS